MVRCEPRVTDPGGVRASRSHFRSRRRLVLVLDRSRPSTPQTLPSEQATGVSPPSPPPSASASSRLPRPGTPAPLARLVDRHRVARGRAASPKGGSPAHAGRGRLRRLQPGPKRPWLRRGSWVPGQKQGRTAVAPHQGTAVPAVVAVHSPERGKEVNLQSRPMHRRTATVQPCTVAGQLDL